MLIRLNVQAAKKENEPKKIAVEKMDVTVAEEDVVQEALAVQDEEVQGDDDMQERTAELEQEAPENVAMDAMGDGDDDDETEEVHDGDNVEMVGGARDAAEPTDADDDGSVDMRGAGDYANEDSNVSDSMDFVDGAGDARALEVLIEADAVANVQEEVMNADRQLEESQAGVDQNRSSDALSICGVAEFRQFISTNQHMTMLHQVIMMNNDMPTSVPGLDVRFCHVAQYLTMFETALQSRL
ncbi:hypothetical protein Q1695_000562 [Nippostrongylus brasiliensis]|nr:hypothetical protein Q1695_000562 [Nippostrongylus brasiliensis]